MSEHKIDIKKVHVRFFESEDIDDIANYFYHSPPGFIESIGLKYGYFGSETEYRDRYTKKMAELKAENKKPVIITVFYGTEKVGFHTATDPIPGQSITIHGHFFNEAFRGKGIGTISGVLAAEKFLTHFNFKEILTKIPLKNKAPLRLVEKLGLPCIGEERLNSPQLISELDAKVFSADLAVIQSLKNKLGIT